MTAVVNDDAEGRGAVPLPRQAVSMVDESRLLPGEPEGDENEIPQEQGEHEPRWG